MAHAALATITFGRAAPGLCVRDIHAAQEFYSRVLGFEKVFENGNPVGFMVMKKDRAEIHLSQKPDHKASTDNVMHMFGSDVAALEPDRAPFRFRPGGPVPQVAATPPRA